MADPEQNANRVLTSFGLQYLDADMGSNFGSRLTAWHDHVDMRMMGEHRTSGMENRGDADAGAEMAGVGGDGDQGLGRRLEQQIVDDDPYSGRRCRRSAAGNVNTT